MFQEHDIDTIDVCTIPRGHTDLVACNPAPRQACDRCGALVKLPWTAAGAHLCATCSRFFRHLPEGPVRCCLERFLLGNVI